MEEMVAKHIHLVQDEFQALTGEGPTTRQVGQPTGVPATGSGAWTMCIIQVHDDSKGKGLLQTVEKEKIQQEIEMEMALCFNGFLEAD